METVAHLGSTRRQSSSCETSGSPQAAGDYCCRRTVGVSVVEGRDRHVPRRIAKTNPLCRGGQRQVCDRYLLESALEVVVMRLSLTFTPVATLNPHQRLHPLK
jgi:hypothetical protein